MVKQPEANDFEVLKRGLSLDEVLREQPWSLLAAFMTHISAKEQGDQAVDMSYQIRSLFLEQPKLSSLSRGRPKVAMFSVQGLPNIGRTVSFRQYDSGLEIDYHYWMKDGVLYEDQIDMQTKQPIGPNDEPMDMFLNLMASTLEAYENGQLEARITSSDNVMIGAKILHPV